MAFNTDKMINTSFGVIFFMVIIGVIAGSLLSTTDVIPQSDPFTTSTIPLNFTLTQTNNPVLTSVTNASGTVINAGNYTFYADPGVLEMTDNTSWNGDSILINYNYDPAGRLTGASAILVGLMTLVIIIVFLRSLVKKQR